MGKALELYLRASGLGSTDAEVRLGDMCMEGRGVPKDEDKAIRWYRKSAEQGDDDAADRLLKIYGYEE